MPKIRTLLVDDEYLALNLLEGFLGQLDDVEVLAKIRQPLQALEFLSREPVDLLFLDIQMPRLRGTDLLRSLPRRPVTIFTTAYSEFAVDAFGLDAVDYLTKPFSFERLLQALNKARQALRPSAPAPEAVPAAPTFLTVKADGQYRKVPLTDILFVEAWQEYVRIHTPQGVLVTLASKIWKPSCRPASFCACTARTWWPWRGSKRCWAMSCKSARTAFPSAARPGSGCCSWFLGWGRGAWGAKPARGQCGHAFPNIVT